MPHSSAGLKLPCWKWQSLELVILETVQKWNSETWYIPQVPDSFNILIPSFPIFQIPKPTSLPYPDPPSGSCLSSLNLLQSGGKSGEQSPACPLCPRATSTEKYQQLIIGTSYKNKKRFPKLFETLGLTFQPSDVLHPFQM